MMHTKKYGGWLLLSAGFMFSFLLRAAFAFFPPALLVYEPQELSVLFAIVGLFVGLTPAATTLWSIGSIALPLSFVFGLDFVFGSGRALAALCSHDPSAAIVRLSAYLARVFLEPGGYLTVVRIVVSLVSAAAPVALFVFFRKQGMKYAGLASLFIFATSPFLVSQGSQAMTDSLAFTFSVLLFVQLLSPREEKRRLPLVLAGVFFGAAVAGKFPYVAFLPVVLVWILWQKHFSWQRALKDCLAFVFSAAVVLLVLVPFIWLEPAALFKNITGNLSMNYLSTPVSGSAFYWKYLARDCGALFMSWKGWLVFVPLGMFASFILLDKKRAVLLIIGCGLFLFTLGFSHSAYTRYAMPLFIFVGIYVSVFFEFLARTFPGKRGPSAVLILIFLIAAPNIVNVSFDFKRTHARSNLTDCIAWVNKSLRPSATVAIPRELSLYFYADAACLRQWRDIYQDKYRHLDERIGVYFSLNKMKLGEQNRGSPLLPEVFGSLERQKIFQCELLLWYYELSGAPANSFRLVLYDEPGSDAVTTSFSNVRKLYAAFSVDVLVACEVPDLDGVLPVKVFDGSGGPVYYVYVNRFLK